MMAADTIAPTTISQGWKAPGGDPPKLGRARASYRDGDNPEPVSLSNEKSVPARGHLPFRVPDNLTELRDQRRWRNESPYMDT